MSFNNLQEWEEAVNKRTAQVWMQNGSALAFDPLNPELGVTHVLPDDEDAEMRETRLRTFQALMDFVWADGSNPIAALKRLFVITRYASPGHLMHMNQSDVAVLLNETRAATQLREKKVWEDFLKRTGFLGTRTRLQKSDEAREAYQQVQQGNACRYGGKAAVRKYSALRTKKPNKKTKR